ncbi:MAG: hypothetical protein KKC20_11710 [Proteobacteria bacterium]|nr:hypothetical protein [Pseudomonadota bacterium]
MFAQLIVFFPGCFVHYPKAFILYEIENLSAVYLEYEGSPERLGSVFDPIADDLIFLGHGTNIAWGIFAPERKNLVWMPQIREIVIATIIPENSDVVNLNFQGGYKKQPAPAY